MSSMAWWSCVVVGVFYDFLMFLNWSVGVRKRTTSHPKKHPSSLSSCSGHSGCLQIKNEIQKNDRRLKFIIWITQWIEISSCSMRGALLFAWSWESWWEDVKHGVVVLHGCVVLSLCGSLSWPFYVSLWSYGSRKKAKQSSITIHSIDLEQPSYSIKQTTTKKAVIDLISKKQLTTKQAQKFPSTHPTSEADSSESSRWRLHTRTPTSSTRS